jgi:hypothetical protein
MKTQFKTKLQSRISLLTIALAFILINGCTSNDPDSHSAASASTDKKSSPTDEIVPPKNPEGFSGAIGNVVKFSGNEVEISTNDKPLTIKLTDSLRIYAPSPSSLANVKSSEYVGAVSKKQPDQPDLALKVLIMPDELRGLNEGSFMLPADKPADSEGRMTNGSASDVASSSDDSRMSNGSVSESDTTSLTLQFQGHSRTITVPPGTPVVEYKVTDKKPAPGDKIFLLVKKGDHDALVSSRIVCF